MNAFPLWMQILALVVLLLLSAVFSIAETSMMALNRYRLKALVRKGVPGAALTTQLLVRTDRLLSMVLIGNNLLNAAASALVTAIAISRFGNDDSALFLATSLVAFLIIVFSEITPKVIGATFPEKIALPLSFLLRPLALVFYPVVWFVNLFSGLLLRMFGIGAMSNEESGRLSPEEIRTLVLESSNYIPKKHTSILLNLFDLESVTINDVMTPRTHVEALDLDDSIETISERLRTCYHNKLPVFSGEINRIRGILHVRKCLALLAEGPLTRDGLEDALVEAYFIPSGTAVIQQLQYFQENRQRQGIVVDEYGEVLGLVTLEDIIEELVGEFTTSMPRVDQGELTWNQHGEIIVDGGSSLRDLNRRLGLVLPTDGPKTLNGLILEELQAIPDSAVCVRIGNCVIEIVQVLNQTVKIAKLTKVRDIRAAQAARR